MMERSGLTNIESNRCEKLRWKGMFIEAEWDPTIRRTSNDGAFWCQHSASFRMPPRKARKTALPGAVRPRNLRCTKVQASIARAFVPGPGSRNRQAMCRRNWRGLVIDGDARYVEMIEADPISHQRDLIAKCAFITSDIYRAAYQEAGLAGEIGILSIDIDGNDYWVWKAIENVRPHIVIVEYNAVFGDLFDLVIPYDPSFERTRAHYSNLYWGASIGAFTRLGKEKGYTLLGSNWAGSNAFFIRNDGAQRFLDVIADTAARPSRFRESRDREGKLTRLRGRARADVIAECKVLDLASGRLGRLDSFGQLYSARWLAMLD